MSPSQEVLNSIENRLRELEQEIVALQTTRSELQAREEPLQAREEPPRPRRTTRRARKPASDPEVAPVAELTEEEWVKRRAAELAAQSRRAAA